MGSNSGSSSTGSPSGDSARGPPTPNNRRATTLHLVIGRWRLSNAPHGRIPESSSSARSRCIAIFRRAEEGRQLGGHSRDRELRSQQNARNHPSCPCGPGGQSARRRLGKKRIEAPSSHTRARVISAALLYSRELNHSRQRQSDHVNHKALQARKRAKHVKLSASDSHIERIF